MEIITVHTTQNIDIDYEIGGLGERIVARLIDSGIFIPIVIFGMIFASFVNNIALGLYIIIMFALFVFYDLLCEVFFNGQSLGKRVMKIRVISLDGARPKFSQYLLRWLFRMVDFGVTGGLAALVSAAMTDNGQRIGDLVAGTALIRTTPRTGRDKIVFANVEDGYQPVFPRVSQLNDRDIALVHEVIENYYKSGNNIVVYNVAEKIKEVLSIASPPDMNSLQFLQTIIKDYSHIAAQAEAL